MWNKVTRKGRKKKDKEGEKVQGMQRFSDFEGSVMKIKNEKIKLTDFLHTTGEAVGRS